MVLGWEMNPKERVRDFRARTLKIHICINTFFFYKHKAYKDT